MMCPRCYTVIFAPIFNFAIYLLISNEKFIAVIYLKCHIVKYKFR